MVDTPKHLLGALDMITARRPPAVGPETMSLHRDRVRTAFEDRNVVGVGISEKTTEKKGIGELCLCFYVVKKKPLRRLQPKSVIPPVVAAPDGKSVFTDVKEIGKVVPEVKKRLKPLQSGYSTCHFDDTAGTLGAVVQKGKKFYILSNSHVLARGGMAKKGDAILYPSPFDDGNKTDHTVAKLSHFKQFIADGNFRNQVDAALAEIVTQRLAPGAIDFAIEAATKPLATIKPVRGMKVVKVGRTTGKTEGEIEDVNFRVVISYDGVGEVAFLDQVQCTRYTQGGDSGSIVVEKKSGKIVGLHFAGSPSRSIFHPINEVVNAFGFRFTSG